MLDIAFAAPRLPTDGTLVLPLPAGAALAGLAAEADRATAGAIARALEAAEFKGDKGKTCLILAPGGGFSLRN